MLLFFHYWRVFYISFIQCTSQRMSNKHIFSGLIWEQLHWRTRAVRGSEILLQMQNNPKILYSDLFTSDNTLLNFFNETIHFMLIPKHREKSYNYECNHEFDLNLSNCIMGNLKIINLKVHNCFSLNFDLNYTVYTIWTLIVLTIILQNLFHIFLLTDQHRVIHVTWQWMPVNKYNLSDFPNSTSVREEHRQDILL